MYSKCLFTFYEFLSFASKRYWNLKFSTAIFYVIKKKSAGQKKIKSFWYRYLISVFVHFRILPVENNSKFEIQTSFSTQNSAGRDMFIKLLLLYTFSSLYLSAFLPNLFTFTYYKKLVTVFRIFWIKKFSQNVVNQISLRLSFDNLCYVSFLLLFLNIKLPWAASVQRTKDGKLFIAYQLHAE